MRIMLLAASAAVLAAAKEQVLQPGQLTQPTQVQIPDDVAPGSQFQFMANGVPMVVTCPPDAQPGQMITVEVPVDQPPGLSYGGSPPVLGHYGACSILRNGSKASFDAYAERWQPVNDQTLYYVNTDRCWWSLYTCELNLASGDMLQLNSADEIASGTQLSAGKYLTVLGPATSYGVAANASFGDHLRRYLDLPVLNLGRGAAGPRDFVVRREGEPEVVPLLAQSAAVIIVVMAGRSSANSVYPDDMDAMDRARKMRELKYNDNETFRKLLNESLDQAMLDYEEVVKRIVAEASELGRPAPRFALLWLSECKLDDGCEGDEGDELFPQYYVKGSTHRLRELAARIDADLVDAYHGDVERMPLPTNGCGDCAPPPDQSKVCGLDEARSMVVDENACTSCAFVSDLYYAPDEAHRRAAKRLKQFAESALNSPGDAAAAPAAAAPDPAAAAPAA